MLDYSRMIGQTVSHYKIIEKLGEGGMGVVYRAHDTKLERDVALKFLPPYLASEPGQKERFFQEARAASVLNHPNITTIHEIDEHYEQIFIAMELVEGKTLKELVKAEPLTIKKVLDIAIQVCDGLTAAAEKQVVHRDIKSDNIILTPKMQVKIMDFGLAKVKGDVKLTKTGSTVGTAAYMSPEQASGEEVDHRSDIFSFGVVLYELLTGKLPFRGEHPSGYIYSILNEEPPPLARFNDKVSPELQRMVSRALEKDKQERYQHIDDLAAELRHERKNLEYAKSTTLPKAEAVHKPKRKMLKILVLTSMVVVLAALFLVFNPFKVEVSRNQSTAAFQNSLAVMYFENIPDPEDKDHTGEMLTNLLITSLFQAKNLEVISRERLYDIQKEFGHTEAKSIAPSLATQIAQRAGVSMMLLGSVLQQQPNLTVTFRLIEVKSGKILSTQRLAGFSNNQIFPLVDSMAVLVRNDLKLTPASATEAKSVAEVTTGSPEAYRSYLAGIELAKKFYQVEARAAFRRAIELDTGFAMAYFQLAFTVGTDAPEKAALKKAWQLKGRVTERERLQIQAAYVKWIENNPQKSAEILEKLLQKYPHEQAVYDRLALLYQSIYAYDHSMRILQKGLAYDSLDKNLWNSLAYLEAGLNKKAEALAAVDRYIALAPAEPNPYDSKAELYWIFGELDSAFYWYEKAISLREDFWSLDALAELYCLKQNYEQAEKYFGKFANLSDPQKERMGRMGLGFIPLRQGQFTAAKKQFVDLASSFRSQKDEGGVIWSYLQLLNLAYEMQDYRSVLAYARTLISEFKKDPDNLAYGRDILAWASLKTGDRAAAYRLMEEIKRDFRNRGLANQKWFQAQDDYFQALFAYEEGKYSEAVELYQKAFSSLLPNRGPEYRYAVSLLKTGRTGEAIGEFTRVTWWPQRSGAHLQYFYLSNLPTWFYLPIASVKAHFWLGVAYEQKGDKQEAIKEYQKFLEIWKAADPGIAEVADAKARLAKLRETALR